MSDEGTADGVPEEELLADLTEPSDERPVTAGEVDAAVTARIEEVEEEFWELVEDVRSRIVQVKREADAKAPAEHEHGELVERVDGLSERVEASSSTLEALEQRVEAGFENFEEVLDYLLETSDELDDHTDRLARAVVGLRERLDTVEGARTDRDQLEALLAVAHRQGVRRATCEACGDAVELALLRRPACPHCDAPFDRLDPSHRWFLGSNTLRTGRPALEGSVADAAEDTTSTPDGDLTDIDGIGAAYADRLSEAGIETRVELAGADPEALGRRIDVSPKRVAGWVERAGHRDDLD